MPEFSCRPEAERSASARRSLDNVHAASEESRQLDPVGQQRVEIAGLVAKMQGPRDEVDVDPRWRRLRQNATAVSFDAILPVIQL